MLLNSRIFAGAADLTGQSNKVELACEVEDKDVTAFKPAGDPDAGWAEVLGGLASTSISASGQWEAGDPGRVDDESWAALAGRSRHPWTICPVSAAVGELAWVAEALRTEYTLGDAVGEVAPWEAQASGTAPLLRGQVAHPPGTARTASGSGVALNLGALTAGQRVCASLHVLSVAGTAAPVITARVESSGTSGFATATTRATFAAAGTPGGQVARVAGPVTDTWWRLAWTISGTAPSFLFMGAVAVA
ncbi:hypothetical protein [Sphaerimonospora thailandensis]|uniref:hypothetical protein n=1 Tax=Sphaerimonospora thailandensis TaxID=795644 RepID=UPI00195280B2|nr:hypothetical protein [Sphaerimonospora thailandensis]